MTLGMGARFIARKDLELPRRSLLKGLAGIFAVAVAPPIVRATSIMPIKVLPPVPPMQFMRSLDEYCQRGIMFTFTADCSVMNFAGEVFTLDENLWIPGPSVRLST